MTIKNIHAHVPVREQKGYYVSKCKVCGHAFWFHNSVCIEDMNFLPFEISVKKDIQEERYVQ